ncbi:hypothetical protein PsYK624_156060 [Phanerochaete sordida]|uniref:Uncharacterized protein n=1 Tax=Phanerochaete sordida TaxID=48140 RepID=A0A9P3GPW4_9APHY|nr:hypothetical protein PsYK624_156060 [Phanerochaete sordida]
MTTLRRLRISSTIYDSGRFLKTLQDSILDSLGSISLGLSPFHHRYYLLYSSLDLSPGISRPSNRPDEDVLYAHFDASLIPATSFKVASNTIPTLYTWTGTSSARLEPCHRHSSHTSWPRPSVSTLCELCPSLGIASTSPCWRPPSEPRRPRRRGPRQRAIRGEEGGPASTRNTDSALRLRTHSLR